MSLHRYLSALVASDTSQPYFYASIGVSGEAQGYVTPTASAAGAVAVSGSVLAAVYPIGYTAGAIGIAGAVTGLFAPGTPANVSWEHQGPLEVKYFNQANFPPVYYASAAISVPIVGNFAGAHYGSTATFNVEINFNSSFTGNHGVGATFDVPVDVVSSFEGSHGVSSTFDVGVAVVGTAILGHSPVFASAPNNAANFSWYGKAAYMLPGGHAADFRQPADPVARFDAGYVGVVAEFIGGHYGSTGVFVSAITVAGTASGMHGVNIFGDATIPLNLTGSDRWFSYFPIARRPSPFATLRYSGGAANSLARNSFGGPVSNTVAKYPDSQTYTQSTIPGLTIAHATHNPTGNGYLQYTAINKMVTWTNQAGAVSSTILEQDGWYAVGTTVAGFLRFYAAIASLPSGDMGQTITIADALGTLFDTPASNELASGATEYRALYLVNESPNRMTEVVLRLISDTPASSVYVGSTFNPLSTYATPQVEGLSFSVFNHKTMTPPISTSLTSLVLRERLVSLMPNGTPRFPYYATDMTQNSNGVDLDIELQLQDRYDSTNKLEAVEWSDTLLWASIPAGRMVSFWVKRVMPPNPVVPLTEIIDFDISFILI